MVVDSVTSRSRNSNKATTQTFEYVKSSHLEFKGLVGETKKFKTLGEYIQSVDRALKQAQVDMESYAFSSL